MHEWKLAEAVVEEVLGQARTHGLARIEKVRLMIGADVHLTADAMRECLAVLGKGTGLEAAHLEIEEGIGRGVTVASIEGQT